MLPFIDDAKTAILEAIKNMGTDLKPTIETIKTSVDQKLGNSTDVELDATIFGRLAEIKKISAERRTQIATTLGLMDVDGLSGSNTAKELADGLDTIPVHSKMTATMTTTGVSTTIPRGYHPAGGTIRTNIANLTASNIKFGVNVGGVVGSFAGEVSALTYSQIFAAGSGKPWANYSFGTKIISLHLVGFKHYGKNPVFKTSFASMALNQVYYIDSRTGALSSDDTQMVSIKRLSENSFDIKSTGDATVAGIAIHYV